MATKTHVTTYIADFSALRLSDAEEAGGKGANLGELVAARLPVGDQRPCQRATEILSVDVTD